MKKYIFILGMEFFFLTSCEIKIVPLKPFVTNSDIHSRQGNILSHRSKYFLVKNYNDTPENRKKIREFALQNLDSDYKELSSHYMFFYKQSYRTHENYDEHDNLDWHNGEDLVCQFVWFNGELVLVTDNHSKDW